MNNITIRLGKVLGRTSCGQIQLEHTLGIKHQDGRGSKCYYDFTNDYDK
jgi:hypothetical protein